MAKTQYELLVEQANKPRKAQTIKPISMDYNPTSFSGNSGNGLGFSAPSARRNTNTGYVGSVMSGGAGYGGTNYGSSSTKKTGSSTAQMIANADPYMDEQTRNVINSTHETFSKAPKQKQMRNTFNDTLNYKPSSTAWQTNGESSLYGFSGGSYKPSTPTITPMDEEEEYVYNGPNYMDQLRSLYNSLYGSNIDAANSAYAQLKAEAERQALIKKGQAHTRKVTMGKYVPETLRAMGLKNNGLAADALIGIDANYMRYLMQALAQEENAKAEASRYLAEQTRAANNQKALWNIELLGKQQDAWTMLQQMAASGDYGEEFLQNYGYSWGFDKNQVGNTLDVYKKVLAKQEAEKAAAEKAEQQLIIDAQNSLTTGYINNIDIDPDTTLMAAQASLLYGEITRDQYNQIKAKYDEIYAVEKQGIEVNDESFAISKAKNIASGLGVKVYDNPKVVNVNDIAYNSSQFGFHFDTGKAGSKQENYVEKIVSDAKAGKIKEGQVVMINYGSALGGHNAYIYVGNGYFVTVPVGAGKMNSKTDKYENCYIPEGYYQSAGLIYKK